MLLATVLIGMIALVLFTIIHLSVYQYVLITESDKFAWESHWNDKKDDAASSYIKTIFQYEKQSTQDRNLRTFFVYIVYCVQRF